MSKKLVLYFSVYGTAMMAYMNEEAVGKAVNRAIADGIAKREELFITTKVWVSNMKTEDTAYESVKTSLAKLGLDYVDLILLHQPMGDYFAAYRGITKAYKEKASPELVKELQNHVKNATAPYKYPRVIEFVDELPKTTSGKIMRTAIRKADEAKYKEAQAAAAQQQG